MELKDTIELMNSQDYKERFKAEYLQLKIRKEKLSKLIIKQEEEGKFSLEPTCSIWLLKMQETTMENYLDILERRAKREKINLKELKNEN